MAASTEMHAEIDHRDGFLLSRVEEGVTIEDLIDLSGMARVDALRVIAECVALGLIAFE